MSKKVPMWLFGIVGSLFSAFCLLGYAINEAAYSVQATTPLLYGLWIVVTVFALVFTVACFFKKGRMALASIAISIISMVIYFVLV